MTEEAAIWMFFSIVAICFTWFRVASLPRQKETSSAKDLKFIYNGKPIDGFIQITADDKTSTFKVVGGKIA